MPAPISTRLIIFTRFPEPGTTKTRLIGALGEEGAADLQRRLTERLAARVRAFVRAEAPETGTGGEAGIDVEVRFEGGDAERMRQWLGEGAEQAPFAYRPQGCGDLGERMERAFNDAFGRDDPSQAAGRVVLAGSDIPDLTAEILKRAFAELESHDLVLGPAEDGGYYLIGLTRPAPGLFRDVPWGADRVLARTREIAGRLGLSVRLLETLRDVDRPEDLQTWDAL